MSATTVGTTSGTTVTTQSSAGYMGYSPMTIFLIILLLVVVAMLGYKYYAGRKSEGLAVQPEPSTPAEAAETEL